MQRRIEAACQCLFLSQDARSVRRSPRASLCQQYIFISSSRHAWSSLSPTRASGKSIIFFRASNALFFYFQPETFVNPHARLCDSGILFEPVRGAEFVDPHSCLRGVNILFIFSPRRARCSSSPTRASAGSNIFYISSPRRAWCSSSPTRGLWEVDNSCSEPAERAPFVEPTRVSAGEIFFYFQSATCATFVDPHPCLCDSKYIFICSPRHAWCSSISTRVSVTAFFFFFFLSQKRAPRLPNIFYNFIARRAWHWSIPTRASGSNFFCFQPETCVVVVAPEARLSNGRQCFSAGNYAAAMCAAFVDPARESVMAIFFGFNLHSRGFR